jgi:hypothetical protein
MKPNDFNSQDQAHDAPLELVPDDPDDPLDESTMYRPRRLRQSPTPRVNGEHKKPNSEIRGEQSKESTSGSMGDALQWALDALHHPALASADWLARDIDPSQPSAAAMLTNPGITLEQIRQAKAAFKTMRIVGEKAADRRIGARMYAAAIAAGLVRFNRKISTQSDEALKRGFEGLLDDRRMPQQLRDLAGNALSLLHSASAKDIMTD